MLLLEMHPSDVNNFSWKLIDTSKQTSGADSPAERALLWRGTEGTQKHKPEMQSSAITAPSVNLLSNLNMFGLMHGIESITQRVHCKIAHLHFFC